MSHLTGCVYELSHKMCVSHLTHYGYELPCMLCVWVVSQAVVDLYSAKSSYNCCWGAIYIIFLFVCVISLTGYVCVISQAVCVLSHRPCAGVISHTVWTNCLTCYVYELSCILCLSCLTGYMYESSHRLHVAMQQPKIALWLNEVYQIKGLLKLNPSQFILLESDQ